MEKENLEYWAGVLNGARIKAKPILQISKEIVSFSRTDAYTVQELQWQMHEADGEKQVGWKMGLTSEAKRKQMNWEVFSLLLRLEHDSRPRCSDQS